MGWSNAVVTNAGIVLLKQVLAGEILNVDGAAGGVGTINPSSLMAQTALKNQKQVFSVGSSTDVPTGKKIKVQVTSKNSDGYQMQQVGIFAHVGNGASVLFAILQDEVGLEIPSWAAMPDFSLGFFAVINFSNEASFSVTVDPSALVSREELDDEIKKSEDRTSSRMEQRTTTATHTKLGTMHKLEVAEIATEGLQQVAFRATAPYIEGDTWGVNGIAYTAVMGGEEPALPEGLFITNNLVSLTLDPISKTLGFRSGGKPPVPSIFGDGSDGDLVVRAGQTVTLTVPVPHQSVVVRNYMSILIEDGGALECDTYNSGLLLRCKKSCIIRGVINQSGKAPQLNANTTFVYPPELMGGNGGNGGDSGYGNSSSAAQHRGVGGIAMGGRHAGGGYGAGGGGGMAYSSQKGGNGGNTNDLIFFKNPMFVGGVTTVIGQVGQQGLFGGGGSGGSSGSDSYGPGGRGGNSPGGDGSIADYGGYPGTGGGAGNVGGGVVMLYCGGRLEHGGSILCNGGNGGNGAKANTGAGGGGGGAGGGGGVYIMHNDVILLHGTLQCNGGLGGLAGTNTAWNIMGQAGQAGSIGTVTIKKYEKGMTA